MPSKPRLLYLSPLIPAFTGNGLAMRGAMVLRALAAHYKISLRVCPLYASPVARVPPELTSFCESVEISTDPTISAEAAPFDVLHVFRLASLAFARANLIAAGPRRAARHLDLDDVESTTRRRIAALYRANNEPAMSEEEERAAERARVGEDLVLRVFDRVYVCSDADRVELLERGPLAKVLVLPNAVIAPRRPPPLGRGDPYTFLFVGTLGYYPNEDAIRFFCSRVLPLVRSAAPRPFRVQIIGAGATEEVIRLACQPDVEVIGGVPDLAPWYTQADAAIVPLRAGGGTRIKILEAFAFGRPIVSTALGAEGLDLRPGEHVLIGDTPMELAAHCLRLMDDPALASRLVERASALLRARYSPEALAEAVRPGPLT